MESVSLGKRLLDVSLTIEPGVTAVLGHSGAGKSSLLNLLVGFETATRGTISGNPPMFWVPQEHGLWPHLTVRQHLRTVKGDERLMAEFDLVAKADCLPETLSVGERARLAVARALATNAAVLVMDEPLEHVAPMDAVKYWEMIRRHLAQTGMSLVFATHEPKSVLAEARRVVCLRDGRVIYNGAVEELYWQPATAELAACLGESNWLQPEEARVWLGREELAARCFRPEQVAVERAAESPVVVESSRFRGAVAEVNVRHEATGGARRFWHRPAGNHLAPGTRVKLTAKETA